MEEGEKKALLTSSQSVAQEERISKREINRRRRQEHRLLTRDAWLERKKLKRKEKQQKRRELRIENTSFQGGETKVPSEKISIEKHEPSIVIIFDMSFDDYMLPKERSSLNLQLCRSYGLNRKAPHPVHIILTGVSESTLEALNRMSVSNWKGVKVFSKHWSLLTIEDLDSAGIPCPPAASATLIDGFARPSTLLDQFVYLTGDSAVTLENFSKDKFYIIGGIVDKNRHKELTLKEAAKYGIGTAKLPIRENIKLTSSSILTCNQIFELILRFLECSDWPETLQSCIPTRKKMDCSAAE